MIKTLSPNDKISELLKIMVECNMTRISFVKHFNDFGADIYFSDDAGKNYIAFKVDRAGVSFSDDSEKAIVTEEQNVK